MSDESKPSVQVTLDSIYSLLLDLKAKVDSLPDDVKDHEARLRVIEKNMWLWLGASALGGGIASQLGGSIIGGL